MTEAKKEVMSFSESLTNKLVSVEEALPKDFNKTRFVQNALTVINENPSLAKSNPAQLQLGLLKGAYLGLDFMSKEAYLIPYGNSVNFQTSYQGEKKIVKRYSVRPIKDIYAKVVREGDEYENTIINNEPHITFKPVPFSNKPIAGVFAVCEYVDGGIQIEEMSTDEINAVRNNYSRQANGNTWKKSWDEMARKTVLRRLCKHIDIDFDNVEARQAWDDGSDADFSKKVKANKDNNISDVFDDVVADVEAVEVEG